ncbi:MAG: hypothetical protein LBO77_06010 [Desulfovibrio sp.]|jgi:hypothetical protein|nr:hypothetical protein [Desulfovibrio sp.]
MLDTILSGRVNRKIAAERLGKKIVFRSRLSYTWPIRQKPKTTFAIRQA